MNSPSLANTQTYSARAISCVLYHITDFCFCSLFAVTQTKHTRTEHMVNGYDEQDFVQRSSTSVNYAEAKPRRSKQTKKELTEFEITRLIRNAPPGSVKQSINVEREEEEIIGPLPLNVAEGSSEQGPDGGLLNFDTISEKVDIGIVNGKAQLAVRVRCERVVPIRGVDDMFKKSSVIVTRLIEIDLEVTEERRELLQNIMTASRRPAIEAGSSKLRSRRQDGRHLSTKDTFKLYKAFMGMAEAEEGRKHKTVIEKRLEDDKNLPEHAEFDYPTEEILEDGAFGDEIQMEYDTDALEEQLENQIISEVSGGATLEELPGGKGYMMKTQDPDTISYMSAASEQSDILY